MMLSFGNEFDVTDNMSRFAIATDEANGILEETPPAVSEDNNSDGSSSSFSFRNHCQLKQQQQQPPFPSSIQSRNKWSCLPTESSASFSRSMMGRRFPSLFVPPGGLGAALSAPTAVLPSPHQQQQQQQPPTTANNYNPWSPQHHISRLQEVDGILDLAEQVLDSDDSCFDLNPTPIAPERVHVVDQLPLSTNFDLYSNECNLSDLLFPTTKRIKRESTHTANETTEAVSGGEDLNHTTTPFPIPSNCMSSVPSRPTTTTGDETTTITSSTIDEQGRFRGYQSEIWCERFKELCEFRTQYGHCLVPHNWKGNIPLAQWVKRQRYQYKLKEEGRHSTLSNERQVLLENMGFVWDSHKAAWEERWLELATFKEKHGHCNVPSKYENQPQLSVWVKCQRRQHKLFVKGERSTITVERVTKMNSLGFVWNPRKL